MVQEHHSSAHRSLRASCEFREERFKSPDAKHYLPAPALTLTSDRPWLNSRLSREFVEINHGNFSEPTLVCGGVDWENPMKDRLWVG